MNHFIAVKARILQCKKIAHNKKKTIKPNIKKVRLNLQKKKKIFQVRHLKAK